MDATNDFSARAADVPSGRLYRYRPYCIEEIRLLLRAGDIRFSQPRRFNDPWDCRPLFYAPSDDKAIREVIVTFGMQLDPENAKDTRAEILCDPKRFDALAAKVSNCIQEQLRSRFRILCLSSLRDVPLMWSHYANAHRGICLVLDAKTSIIGKARRVEYPDHYPAFHGWIGPEDHDYARSSFLNKAKYWAYEREYRVIACGNPGEHVDLVRCDKASCVHAGRESLTGIIMGCAMPPQDRQEIIALREEMPQLDLYEARTRHDNYELEIVRL